MKRDKAVQFKKLAVARTNKVCAMLRLIGNLSVQANYEYEKEDVEKMFAYIQRALDGAKDRFAQPECKKYRFSLSGEPEKKE